MSVKQDYLSPFKETPVILRKLLLVTLTFILSFLDTNIGISYTTTKQLKKIYIECHHTSLLYKKPCPESFDELDPWVPFSLLLFSAQLLQVRISCYEFFLKSCPWEWFSWARKGPESFDWKKGRVEKVIEKLWILKQCGRILIQFNANKHFVVKTFLRFHARHVLLVEA